MGKLAAGLLVVALGVTLTGQQTPTPTFKTNVNAVVVDVRVLDGQGRFVGDLTKDDLQIFENGKEQTITAFDRVNIPIRPDGRPRFAGQAVEADVTSNAGLASDAGALEGRLYVLLLDDLHTHPLQSANVRAQAREFLEHDFMESDRAVVLMTSGRRQAQAFTNNRQRLVQAIDQFDGEAGFNALPDCVNFFVDPVFCATMDERAALHSLSEVATWLGSVGGQRKVLLWFGEGLPEQTAVAPRDAGGNSPNLGALPPGAAVLLAATNAVASGTTLLPDRRAASESAARANVAVYPVDPRQDRGTLFTQIVLDASSYYLLGYMPTNVKHDGTFRALDIRTRRSGLTVQARTGYTARKDAPAARPSSGAPSPALTDLMATPIPTAGLTMSVAAPVFLGTRSKASVELIIDVTGRDLTLTSDAAGGTGSVDLLAAIADASGQVKATEHGSLNLKLSPATRTAVTEHGLRVLSRLAVPPGRYLLRIAGVDGGGSSRGSVQYDLDVPDFSKGPLTMSSLALAAASERQRPTTGSDKAWNLRFPEPPTTLRAFAVGDELSVSGEIYRNDKQTGDIDTTTTVQSESGQILFRHQERLTGAKTTSTTFRHHTAISLQGLPPGAYLLTVEARSSLNLTAIASQQIPFTVRAAVACVQCEAPTEPWVVRT